MQEAYIVAFKRSAFAKAKKGGFRFMRSDDLAVLVIMELLKDFPQIEKSQIDDLIVGCANPEGEQGLQIGRQIALRALGEKVPGITINRYCASGLESIAIATAKIRAGMGEIYVAGGIESMSMIPLEGYKLAVNYSVSESNPDYVIGMGLTAEAVANKYKISRDAQDEFSFQSHRKAASAQQRNFFAKEICNIDVNEVKVVNNKRTLSSYSVSQDEGIRPDTTIDALSKLKPVFSLKGSVTAGNSSQTTDGAGFVLVMSESKVKELNLKPIAKLVSCSVAGVDPLYMGIGPCAAIPKALHAAQLRLSDIQLIELNEAFASQSLAVIQEAGLNPEITNVNGGAIALGHPLGCSGARLSMTLINELQMRNQKFGLVTACVGGGQGIAGVFEVLYLLRN
ncbi:MAG: thiolase family protein [Saprospiraceae bacterium]|nr:thiolase family protein [Saprospiraceae bacterium]